MFEVPQKIISGRLWPDPRNWHCYRILNRTIRAYSLLKTLFREKQLESSGVQFSSARKVRSKVLWLSQISLETSMKRKQSEVFYFFKMPDHTPDRIRTKFVQLSKNQLRNNFWTSTVHPLPNVYPREFLEESPRR